MRENRPRRWRKGDKAERNEKAAALCVVTRGSLLTWSCLATTLVIHPCTTAGRQVQAEIQTEDREDDQPAILSCARGQGFVEKDSGLN